MSATDKEGCEKLIHFAFEAKKQPLLFLREKSLKQLIMLLRGFAFGYNNACDYGLVKFFEVAKNGRLWVEFLNHFIEKYNISSRHYLEVIELCGSDEQAFDLLFEELENYLKERNIEIPVIWQEEKCMRVTKEQRCIKLLEFVFGIKKRTLLFLREKSLKELINLMQGFVVGYNSKEADGAESAYELLKDGDIWSEFQSYFSEKYNTSSVYHVEFIEWCGSEEKAFDLFFEELESYLKERNIEIPEIR